MTDNDFIFDTNIPNDRIDISADPILKIKKLDEENDNELRLQIEGPSIDNSVINALRRTIMMSIPIYAFHRSNIFIEVKKSIYMYNNDLIYNQIETLPIFDIPNYFDLENPEKFLPTDVMRSLFGKFIQEKYVETDVDPNTAQDEKIETDINKKLFKIELSLNVKNNTGSDKYVSTHDAVLKIDNKTSNSYRKRDPISIIVLKPNEEVSLRAEANLGISKMHASYEATTNAIHKEITPMKYILYFETLEQLEKELIFTKACNILKKKLQYLNSFIKKQFSEERDISEIIELQLFGEDHTLGCLLATALQKCEYVETAGYNMPHPFTYQIVIKYKLYAESKKGPIAVLIECNNYLVKVFDTILNKFAAVDKK